VQVHPIKPILNPPRTKHLELKCDTPLSTFAVNINLRRYTEEAAAAAASEISPFAGVVDVTVLGREILPLLRQTVLFHSRNESSNCVSMTWRATSGRPSRWGWWRYLSSKGTKRRRRVRAAAAGPRCAVQGESL